MLVTVEGIYNEGKVELKEHPTVDSPSRVIVTFLEARDPFVSSSREELRRRALDRMEEGLALGGPPYPSREELHDRTSR
jgi:hypothetical protein